MTTVAIGVARIGGVAIGAVAIGVKGTGVRGVAIGEIGTGVGVLSSFFLFLFGVVLLMTWLT